ncbi:DUF2029 domain-containing protein (plasmid) [Rhodococcus ruber]|uniref:glycosyltransferase 87 family protein n=1 Tax=Rhodococcus ruber TaxID=1830 RepID=UPI0019340D10|nr:glycosyltransferase 87 family protein [Rhodococcus ruber]QRE83775.1 DUF2029 domain-containing protein [Rhodococcus ruber]QRE83804.1 DUF2029 domain-containing protein [Rhodococcus ruber]
MPALARLLGAVEPRTARSPGQAAGFVLWPLAVLVVAQRLWWSLSEPFPPARFRVLYDASFAFLNPDTAGVGAGAGVPPLSPGAALLTAPLAVLTPDPARWGWHVLGIAALLGAWALLLPLLELSVRSWLAPLLLLGTFLSGPVTSTVLTDDLGAFVLLALVAWLHLSVHRHQIAAALALGAVLALMPVFAPLLAVPVLQRRGAQALTAAAAATLAGALVWARTGQLGVSALDHAAPAPRSIFAAAAYLHLPPAVAAGLAAAVAAAVGTALVLLHRRRADERLHTLTAAGVLLLGCCLLAPAAGAPYSIVLLPLIASVVLPGSVLRTWPAWVAVYALGTDENWSSPHLLGLGTHLEALRPTAGWLLLLATVCAALATQTRHARTPAASSGTEKFPAPRPLTDRRQGYGVMKAMPAAE